MTNPDPIDKIVFRSQSLQLALGFTLKVTVTLVRNDDFLTNGMFPLVADDFTLERL